MTEKWLSELTQYVGRKPAAVMRVESEDFYALANSRKGFGEFTNALRHGDFEKIQAPTLCFIVPDASDEHEQEIYLGIIGRRRPITTLQSRVKLTRSFRLEPGTPDDLVALLPTTKQKAMLRKRLAESRSLVRLSPALSVELVKKLSVIKSNQTALQSMSANLCRPKEIGRNEGLQLDAISTALKAFGLSPADAASTVEIAGGEKRTAISYVRIMEDSVIEHDARSVPGYELIRSDVTGRAFFERGSESLEVITANRRPLEKALGVDLIYYNVTKKCLVMLQYKMLEPPKGESKEWIYKPDNQLAKELSRMKLFADSNVPGSYEYRFNPATFYLKFVKRDALRASGVILPIDHFSLHQSNPEARGPKGGYRLSFEALSGSYMRERPFLDLLRAGYIGAYAETTSQFMTLIEGILKDGKAVVAAIQQAQPSRPSVFDELDAFDDDFSWDDLK